MAMLRCVWIAVLLCCYQRSGVAIDKAGVTFGGNIANNILLTLGDVGTSSNDTLRCFTDRTSCCVTNGTSDRNGEGDWYNPNGARVAGISAGNLWFNAWELQEVHLNYHGDGTAGTTGLFRCDILNSVGYLKTYFVGVYLPGEGALTISGPLSFDLNSDLNADPPEFTLICSSMGGPATSVTWTSPAGGIDYQSVYSQETASYANTLVVTGRHTGDYTCSVSNIRTVSPGTKTLTVTAANPPYDIGADHDVEDSGLVVSWIPPSPTPTGYMIYYQSNDDQGSVMVNNGSAAVHIIYGVKADLLYSVTMVALSEHLPSVVTAPVTALRYDAYMVLDSSIIPNHGLVFHPNIGTSVETGLSCVTRRRDCCSGGTSEGSDETIAEWFDPTGIVSGGTLFRSSRAGDNTDNYGYVYLYKQSTSDVPAQGIYRCIFPESDPAPDPVIATFYVGIYNTNGGTLSIPDPIQFSIVNAAPPTFSLTCTSSGGPATDVTWTMNGSPLSEDSGHILTQTLLSTVTATYNNTLTVTVTGNGELGSYQCSVNNDVSTGSAVLEVAVPSSPMLILSVLDGTNIHVQWNESIFIMRYEVSFARISSGSDQVGCDYEHNGTISVSGSAVEYTITGLEEYSRYTISVVAVSLFSTLPPVIQQATTHTSAPTGAPQQIQAIASTDTSITIRWSAVECSKRNSEITQYLVQYGPADGSIGDTISKTICASPDSEDDGVYVIMGLTLGVQYFVQVAAVNDYEAGPFSDPIITKTIIQCESQHVALAGVGVGCSLGVALLYTAVLGITIALWKKRSSKVEHQDNSIEINECTAYGSSTALQHNSIVINDCTAYGNSTDLQHTPSSSDDGNESDDGDYDQIGQ